MSMQYSILGNRPLDQWKVTELRDELRRRKIVTSGVKAELVKRLDEAVREEFDNGLNPDSDNQDDSHEHEMEFHEDIKEYNSNRSESVDDSIKSISKNAETRDKDSTMVDSDDTNAITGQGNTAQVGESEMVDVDDSNAITGQGNSDQAGGLLGTSDSDGPGYLREDNKDNNSNRSEFTDDSIKTIPENAERRDEDSAMADSDDKNAFTGQGITAQVGELTMVDADYKNAVTGEGNIVQDDGPLGSFDSDGVADQTVILADTVENSITIKQSELTGLGKEEPMDDRAVITNKGSEPTLEIAELDVFNPNNQVSKVDPVSGFQFKCESISTDSAKFNEKFELKDSLNTDNFHLEVEVVKPETLHPLSGDAPPNDGDLHQSADQKPGGNLSHVEEIDDTNAANIELSKKNDSADGASSEKLNLDRSSGDDSLEDEGLESKQIDSVHYSNEAGDENQNVDLRPVKEESPIDSMIEGLSPEKKCNIAENNDLSISAGKRKTEDQAVVINEPSKRHRRWFSQPLKVSESETSHPASLSTPREKFNSVPKRVLAKSDSNLSIDSPKEQIVPQSQKPATNSLRIDRFLRPFTLKAVQELLAKTGTVSSFWMDHIKTHCYVTYSSVEEAVGTRNALYNQQWPPNGGHLLIAEFVDPQEVKARVEAPQAPVPAAAAPSCSQSQPSPRQHGVQQQLPPPPPTREYLRQLPPPPARKPEPPPTVTLDDLFRKTRATPRIYWLPHSEEQVTAKLETQSRESR